jgi:hypothetical protein
MTYFQAKRILDQVKEGIQHPEFIITQALKLTGDIDEL